jgi:hypothetical protein
VNATLQDPAQIASAYKTVADLHMLVIARIVVEWARIDNTFPMRHWGNEMLGSHVGLGLDRWYVGRDDKQAEYVLQITLDRGAYGGPKSQHNWRVSLKELQEKGCRARLMAI